ncbi:DNA-binding transcriptional LysR family regulator [Bradyrhizobium sp. i1.4.4]
MEQDVGQVLLGRERRRLIPTEDAARLYEETARLFTHVEVFEGRIDDFRSGSAGQLSIAAIPTLAGSIVVQAAVALQNKAPLVKVRIVTVSRRGQQGGDDVEIIGETEIVAAVIAAMSSRLMICHATRFGRHPLIGT